MREGDEEQEEIYDGECGGGGRERNVMVVRGWIVYLLCI